MNLRTLSFPLLGLVALAATAPRVAAADSDAGDGALSCPVHATVDKYQLLRRLSLDLRGQLPTYEEYAALDGVDAPSAEQVKTYIASDAFRVAMRGYHDTLFWPNVSNVRMTQPAWNLALTATPAVRLGGPGREKGYRGAADTGCLDVEQKAFDPAHPGEFRPVATPVNGITQEGWRMVAPYWDPTHPIKVCAFDAQETATFTKGNRTLACNAPEASGAPECGCGPNLRYCYSNIAQQAILAALREQLERAVDRVSTGGAPYSDLILQQSSEQNGTIAFWKQWLAPASPLSIYVAPDTGEAASKQGFTDAAWTTFDRAAPHSGVLTLPAYLLRFQTERSRANRFRIDFQCEYFVPPAKLDPAPGCSTTDPDLTKRCNCQYCHGTLEPLAASFGLFAEAGTTLLSDEKRFPIQNPSCIGNENGTCNRFYVTRSDAPRPGYLLPYQFADAHPAYVTSLQGGPRALAQSIVDDGSFARCTTQRALSYFLKRDDVGDAVISSLASDFQKGNYDFPSLVTAIVSLPAYRSLGR